jgi:hypothetical protein
MSFRLLATLVKFAVACLIVGTVLDHFDVSAAMVLQTTGLTPDAAITRLRAGVEWALPTLALGALVIVPAWLLVALFRPPGPERDR